MKLDWPDLYFPPINLWSLPKTTMNWKEYFFKQAETARLKSKDPEQAVGCVIVDQFNHMRLSGFNGFARGVKERPERLLSGPKLKLVVHAEANAIACAARVGVPLEGCTIVTTKFPCDRCAGLIIQSGIKKVITPRIKLGSKWFESNMYSALQFEEAGVEVEYV